MLLIVDSKLTNICNFANAKNKNRQREKNPVLSKAWKIQRKPIFS